MKMKRFLAPDIRQALQQVKEELGPDAVILSNRKTDEGVEIVAARDFDVETVTAKEDGPPKPSQPKPQAKVTPKPAFSAWGYRAVAGLDEEPSGSRPRIKKPDFPQVNTQPAQVTRPRSLQEEMRHRRQAAVEKPQPASRPRPEPPRRDDGLEAVRRELQQMRRLLDQHLAREAWHETVREHPTRLDLLRALSEMGFSRSLAMDLAQRGGVEEEFAVALQQVQRILAEQIPVHDDPLLDYGGIVALVGPTGVGKTTTIAKLAARFRLKHGPRQIALVTTDNYRIAAHEQLSTYARILGVPVRVAANPDELQAIVRGFMDKKLVLIDTAGMSQRDLRLADQFALLRDSEIAIETYLVLSAAAQIKSLYEAIDAFAGFQPRSCILTKLDEAGALGPVLSALVERGLPAAFITDGQQVPEDLHPARAETLVARAFEQIPGLQVTTDMDFAFEDWIAHASV